MESIQLPLSKSIINRCLVLTALSGNRCFSLPPEKELPNDVRVMKRLLFDNPGNEFNVEDAGTVFRFLTAFLSVNEGTHMLFGTSKLNARPIKPLVDVLLKLGADISYISNPFEAPLKITGRKLEGGEVFIDASVSSQFVSALMLVAPVFAAGLKLHLKNYTSLPYIQITKQCLALYNIEANFEKNVITISAGQPISMPETIIGIKENDWSSAAFWYALCISTRKSFRLRNLSMQSMQGDKVCVDLFGKLGVETKQAGLDIEIQYNNLPIQNLEFNMADCPDLAPALIVACSIKNSNVRFYGLETLQYKESNRTSALQTELRKLGIDFIQNENYWQLNRGSAASANNSQLTLNTYNDHRLAMSFASLKAIHNEIQIENPDCVQKSYPMFWREFNRVFPI